MGVGNREAAVGGAGHGKARRSARGTASAFPYPVSRIPYPGLIGGSARSRP